MNKNMNKTVCIYHSIDLDGWMSAAIVKLYDKSIDFIGYNYGDPIPNLSMYNTVIMCDIRFPKDIMVDINNSQKLIWIDHHISAIKEIATLDPLPFFDGLRNEKLAACELTWKYFFPNDKMPEIVRLVGRYDCFGHQGTKEEKKVLEFQYGARAIISNYNEAYHELVDNISCDNTELKIITSGRKIYKFLCVDAKNSYKNGFTIYLNENNVKRKFICINKERFNPINFGIDYHLDGYDGCASFFNANNSWYFSLYNDNKQVDCSIIAQSFGGGGHKGASGFLIKDIETFLKDKR